MHESTNESLIISSNNSISQTSNDSSMEKFWERNSCLILWAPQDDISRYQFYNYCVSSQYKRDTLI